MKKSTQQEYTKRILNVLVFIQKNLDEERSLEEYARVAHFSPYHFHRIFRGMVSKLEAQWWLDGESCDFANAPKDQWNWRLMIRTPPFVKQKELDEAATHELRAKNKQPVQIQSGENHVEENESRTCGSACYSDPCPGGALPVSHARAQSGPV